MAKPYYVYIIRCSDSSLYTGSSVDTNTRIAAHNNGKGAKYTRSRLPVQLVYKEMFENKSAALKREDAIKKLIKEQKEYLCCSVQSRGD